MSASSKCRIDRREFMVGASTMGAAALLGISNRVAAEPPPETKKIRLVKIPALCLAPEYLAEELLRLEGFTDIEYVQLDRSITYELLTENLADMVATAPPETMPALDAGAAIVVLAGIHGGCFELFAHENVRAIRDLKGKRVAVNAIGSLEYYFLASMVAYVGMDPRKDVEWINSKSFQGMRQDFVDKKADAFLAFPPDAQELREQKIGRVIINTAQDRPWEQYYCCMIAARPDYVRRYPVATKRAVRAILKAADICVSDPERAARHLVAREFYPRYEIALDVVRSISYNRWRTYDPEDSLRFFGVRLHEVGMIKNPPNKLIAQGTDWRFVNELKKELKA
jgi:NitT/TauT family transport system substrate-binding protein